MKNHISSILMGCLLAPCIGITMWGLLHTSWNGAGWAHIPLMLFLLIIVAAGGRITGKSSLLVGAALAAVTALAFGAIWPLFVTIWFALASTLLGQSFLRALNADTDSSACQLLVGAGLYGTAVGLLAHFPVNYPGVYGIALAAPFFLERKALQQKFCVARQWISSSQQPAERTPRWLQISIAAVALVYFAVALMPEVGHDALAMHLFIPGHLALRQAWAFDVNTYVGAVMPMLGDCLFSIGYMLAGETAARLINLGFILVICWLLRDFVLWCGGCVTGVSWAILLFLTTPLTFLESSSLYIESVWTAFVVAGSLSLLKLLHLGAEKTSHPPVAGFLLGAALAAKAVTFTLLPVLSLLLLLRYRAWATRSAARAMALGLALFLVVGAIPYATAWGLTGNPLFPYFNQVFQSPFYPAVNFDVSSQYAKGLTWDVVYRATFQTGQFLEGWPGAAGFQWLLLLFPALLELLLSRQYRGVTVLALGGLSIASTFQSMNYLRYVFPSFAWVAAGIGVALSAGRSDSVLARRLLSTAAWMAIVLNLVFFKSGTFYGDISLQPLASASGREAYLNERLAIRNAVELVNKMNLRQRPVAVFSAPLAAGLNSDALYPSWYNHRFQTRVDDARTCDAIARLLFEKDVDYVILDRNWGSPGKRKSIEEATDNLAELGTITVRDTKAGHCLPGRAQAVQSTDPFQTELLTKRDFSTRIAVTVSSTRYEGVEVAPEHQYRKSVTAVCGDQPSQGRLQVNWLDAKSQFISTSINVFDCTSSEVTHSMEVTAPRGAALAVIYASGHTEIPIIFTKVSFKR